MLLEELTMLEFVEGLKKTRTVVIPYGSVEEHGFHLPLSTDTVHIYETARAASSKRPLFVAPPIHYGLCRSTSGHPGTITIKAGTLRRLTIDIVTSLYSQGLRNFILISGHAGGTHLAAITDAGEELLSALPEANIAVLSILDLVGRAARGLVETAGDSHAGEVETSVMLYLRPEWVKGTSPEEYPAFPNLILVRNKRKFWPNGVWGNPARANTEKGKKLLYAAADELVNLAERIEQFRE
ncbi:MAG: creatininase family protein [Desulfovibrionales bacterium]|nr:creatininase family protein [Desulfovibrionales bacterium]